MSLKRFVSADEWFQLSYPAGWTNETDTDGTPMFFEPDGLGVLRVSVLWVMADDATPFDVSEKLQKRLEKVPGAQWVQLPGRRAVYYAQDTEEEQEPVQMHWWEFGQGRAFLMCSYALPKRHAATDRAAKELESVRTILASVTLRAG